MKYIFCGLTFFIGKGSNAAMEFAQSDVQGDGP